MSDFVKVSQEPNGIVILTLNNKSGNSLKFEMIEEMIHQMDQLLINSCPGLIITSSRNLSTFCSGMDLNELCPPKRLKQYIELFERLWFKLYTLPIPTISAMSGHAIAGGCALSICCDYRFITENANMGVPSSAIGFAVPKYIYMCLSDVLSPKIASRMTIEGTILTSEESLNIGLIDGIAKDYDQLMMMARDKMQHLLNIDRDSYASMKSDIRSTLCENYESVSNELKLKWIHEISSENAQKRIREKLLSITSKK